MRRRRQLLFADSIKSAFMRRVSETVSSSLPSRSINVVLDARQEEVVERLSSLCDDDENDENDNSNNNNITSGKRRSKKSGVYLYGSPGRGKTVLVDSFKDAFTNEEKKQIKSLSFRSLMDEMHENLMKIRNVRNPVREIGSRYKKAHEVLIVDEVEVTDVADARIWKAFVESYLTEDDLESEKKNTTKREKNAKKRNILVCTSNFKPKQLYKGGLNWKSLLVSEVLSERLDAVSLDGEEHDSPEKFRDYRKALFAAEEASARETEGETSSLSSSSMIFGDDADASLRLHWEKLMLSSKNRSKRHHHALSDRLEKDIQSAATSIEANVKAAYFDFAALCGANAKWSPRDYENLSKAYEFVFLESIPVLDVAILGEDVVRRFVMVIDALYANKTKLYCSSPSTKSIADLFPQSSSTPSRENSSSSTPTATTTFVSKTGGASGRNATMLSENIEWSATGLTKASLAALSSGSFTDKSKPRCQSRLYEMKTEAYKRDRPA